MAIAAGGYHSLALVNNSTLPLMPIVEASPPNRGLGGLGSDIFAPPRAAVCCRINGNATGRTFRARLPARLS